MCLSPSGSALRSSAYSDAILHIRCHRDAGKLPPPPVLFFLPLSLSSSWPPSCVCPPGVLSPRVPVQSPRLFLLHFSSSTSLSQPFSSLSSLFSLSLSAFLAISSTSCCMVCITDDVLIGWGQPASHSDWPRERWLLPVNADLMSCVL